LQKHGLSKGGGLQRPLQKGKARKEGVIPKTDTFFKGSGRTKGIDPMDWGGKIRYKYQWDHGRKRGRGEKVQIEVKKVWGKQQEGG